MSRVPRGSIGTPSLLSEPDPTDCPWALGEKRRAIAPDRVNWSPLQLLNPTGIHRDALVIRADPPQAVARRPVLHAAGASGGRAAVRHHAADLPGRGALVRDDHVCRLRRDLRLPNSQFAMARVKSYTLLV